MKERPILFSGPMVRAILDGRKTQTRRVMRIQPRHQPSVETKQDPLDGQSFTAAYWDGGRSDAALVCPYGSPGDRLWVRETAWIAPPNFADNGAANLKDSEGRPRVVAYDATSTDDGRQAARDFGVNKTPSIFMPRWASRITLEVVKVHVERVQEINDDDALAEGTQCYHNVGETEFDRCDQSLRDHFADLWGSINAKRGYGWDKNPYVWVIEFKRR